MRLTPEQLSTQRFNPPLPVYLIAGDEPLLREECSDMLRSNLRAQGFMEREVLHVEGQFNWHYLLECANALSLFAQQRLLELRLGQHKVSKAASEILQDYLSNPPQDTVLLIICARLDSSSRKSAWYQAVDRTGACIEPQPVTLAQLPGWIRHRAGAMQLQLDQEAIQLLCDRVEGNLLAAKQELDKLALLYPNSQLGAEQILDSVADSSRYDVYALTDAAAAGQAQRCIKILNVLCHEGSEPLVILWALAREIRTLYHLRQGQERGQSFDSLCQKQRVFGKRKGLLQKASQRLSLATLEALIKRCHQLDRSAKGLTDADPWLGLNDIALMLAGYQPALD